MDHRRVVAVEINKPFQDSPSPRLDCSNIYPQDYCRRVPEVNNSGGGGGTRSTGGGSRKERSSGGGSRKERGSGGGISKKRSYGGGKKTERSSGGGSRKERSSGGGSRKEKSFSGGISKKRSYGGGRRRREAPVVALVKEKKNMHPLVDTQQRGSGAGSVRPARPAVTQTAKAQPA
ncbi:hypothetical protein IGI04_037147 [Brassica rapa subsp. trilocularis]|uniref:Uncharacterized protein n=1 Tax=Brassica rapa subsp. trilocularis TaxID=1813537 RepID=A0ABQ7LHE9_BRACM|nr:hypothetical protein IGI04_037147 [Brassica rapa subsp. trilocularis]